MKFSKVPVGSRFKFRRGKYAYGKTGTSTAVNLDTSKTVALAADDEVVVLPSCTVCAMLEPWSHMWIMNFCWTC
jgi:hypothetical protein